MKKIFVTLCCLGFFGSIAWSYYEAIPDGLLHMYVLDVGQGDAIFIRTPNGENILIDGGPGNTILTELNDVLPLFDQTIDAMYLTSPDKDHYEGLIYVAKKYPVKSIYLTGVAKEGDLFKSMLRVIKEKNIPIIIADGSADLHLPSGVDIDILYPFNQIVGSHIDANNSSIVSKLSYGQNSILLTGDIEEMAENMIVYAHKKGKINLDSDVLKVGHHGSKTSTSQDFLNAASPQIAVISAGKNNRYKHPHSVVLDRLNTYGSKIYRTDEMGRIEIIFSREGIIKINTD